MKHFLILCALFCLSASAAHAQFTFNGKITYERKSNLHKLWEGNEWIEQFKDKMPKTVSNFFELSFTQANSYYKPVKPAEEPKMSWIMPPGAENEVFTDFKTNIVSANKQIYEQSFLLQDTMRKLEWRITNEIRTIADFKCRKAVTKICDSVYVVAFYTDDIPVCGGPEQFGGLPGMILELAVPRLHTTWVATQVTMTTINNPNAAPFNKGKKVTKQQLAATLQKSLKDWGKEASKNVWWANL